MQKKLLLIITALLVLLVQTSCRNKKLEVQKTTIALGTFVQITLVCDNDRSSYAKETIEKSFKLIETLDKKFDYRKKGDLYRFNKSNFLKEKDSPELFKLILDSLNISKLTKGYFDPTIYPLTVLWGFNGDHPDLPDPQSIKEALKHIGYEKILVDNSTITKPEDVMLDLSAIAKGRIVDMVRDFLISRGFKNFLVNAGGDIYVKGKTKDNKLWKIAIQDPFNQNRYLGVLNLTNCSVVTSGDYERFFIKNGIRYCHILNPITGYPPRYMHSVTIINKDTEFSDAIATAVFVMSLESGFNFLLNQKIRGLIVATDRNNRVVYRATDNFWE